LVAREQENALGGGDLKSEEGKVGEVNPLGPTNLKKEDDHAIRDDEGKENVRGRGQFF